MDHIIINKKFNNYEAFAIVAREWNVDFMRTEPGDFEAGLVQFVYKDFQFGRATFNRGLDQRGSAPKSIWTFVITASPKTFLIFKNRKVKDNHLMIYPPGSEINATSMYGLDVLSFSASENFLENLAENKGLPGFKKKFQHIDMLKCENVQIDRLRSLLIHLFTILQCDKTQLNNNHEKSYFIIKIFERAFKAIYNFGTIFPIFPATRLRDYAFLQAIACTHSFAQENLTVKGLILQTGVSEKTLEIVFQERLGISPKQYIRTYRLNQIRRELRSFHFNGKITNLANQWGLWHMGQFAKDYRNLFGELPSETLKNRF